MLDVAIIGGGVAGCYCAYRLAAERGGIALFEGSGRIGGRLWSVPVAGADGPVAEIGGMFFRRNQQNVSALIEHLGLKHEPVNFKRSGQFARGTFFEDADFTSDRLPFKLDAGERSPGPSALLIHTLEQIVPGAVELWPINREKPASAQATFDRLRAVRHHGRPLHVYGLWNVLADVISNEAYALLTAVLGSVSMLRNVNAFDGVWSLLHEVGDGAGSALCGGYQQLPIALRLAAEREGAATHLNRKLLGVSRAGGHFRLRFSGSDDADIEIEARQVILALPQLPLQHLALSDDLFVDARVFRHALDRAVLPMRSCKIFLTYDQAWWGEGGADEVSATYADLPMQQCYRWSNSGGGSPALLMAAYADDVGATFWAPLARPRQDVDGAHDLAASAAMVEAVQRQLTKLRKGDAPPTPAGALYFDWSAAPFGAAWHGWAPHFESWNIRPFMRRPNPSLDLFICGEAYSQRNGWVEGALNSAELVLEQLGLTRPSWINDPDFQFEAGVRGVENDHSNTSDVQRFGARHGAAA
ncbi:MAG: FAD-dependent oxidoreductase [Hyphomonadaceae bacterium]|nr:FAD-dependent oxidoreductase [Hyphomonadaceae bacterium]